MKSVLLVFLCSFLFLFICKAKTSHQLKCKERKHAGNGNVSSEASSSRSSSSYVKCPEEGRKRKRKSTKSKDEYGGPRFETAQHFLELLAGLSMDPKLYPRKKIFGLYFADHRIFSSFLEIEGVKAPDDVYKYLRMLSTSHSGAAREDIAKEDGQQLHFVSARNFLNLFVPQHFSALVYYLQYLVLCERIHVFVNP